LNADGDCISFCQGKIIGHNAGFGHQKTANGEGIGIGLTYDDLGGICSETNYADGVLVGPIQN
jgi:hypothetical protein